MLVSMIINFFQVESARLYCKFSARPPTIEQIPYFVERVSNYIMIYRVHENVSKSFAAGNSN